MSIYESAAEKAADPKPNNQIQGLQHAAPGAVLPTINLALGKANVTQDFKYDESKQYYSIKTDLWDPVHPITREKYRAAGKVDARGNVKVLQTPDQKAEVLQMDQARFPDHTYKYLVSYTHFKRMWGNDGQEYLVRYGYFHGQTFMGVPWKWFKMDFDFHYEPLFEPNPTLTGSSFDINYGDIYRQVKVYHTKWDHEEFDKLLKDIPFPNNPKIGVSLKVGVEGAPSVATIPDLKAFRNKSFEDLMKYVESNDISWLEEDKAPEEPVKTSKKDSAK